MRPRMNQTINAGASVIESRQAKNIENVLVNARGRKSRPSCAVKEKTGRKLTVITSKEKNRGRPTDWAAAIRMSTRSFPTGSCPVTSR